MGPRTVATVLTVALASAVTVAHAAPLPVRVGTVLAFSEPLVIDLPEPPGPPAPVVLVDGFGTPAPGEPLAPPWTVPAGALNWTDDGAVRKPGGLAPGDNIAVVDVGRSTGIAVQVTVVGLRDGPRGGAPSQVGLSLLSDGTGQQQVLVVYERATGQLTVRTPDAVLGAVDIGAGRDALGPLRAELLLSQLEVWLEGELVLTVADLPTAFATNTNHGIYVSRDNRAAFTEFRIEAQP